MSDSDSIGLEELQALCDEHERLLRAQTPDGKLEVDVEAELAGLPATTARLAIARLALLKHVYRVAWQRKDKPRTEEASDAEEAARALLRREPVVTTLANGREVTITGRSYGALLEISAHYNRIRLLTVDLNHVGERYEQVMAKAARLGWFRRRKTRNAARRWAALYTRIATEILRHRERLLAHALTASGAPARRDERAPEWWVEASPEDDARLLLALYEVGPARYARLGPLPESKRTRKGEDFGFASLLVGWGIRTKVDPAAMWDRDLGQLLTEARVSAPPSYEEAIA